MDNQCFNLYLELTSLTNDGISSKDKAKNKSFICNYGYMNVQTRFNN
jgi:hypothetical protein